MIDVILVSDAKNDKLKKITEQAIHTSRQRCVVIESNLDVNYTDADTIHFKQGEFNYNKALNMGAEFLKTNGTSEYMAFCNNDLVFTPRWYDIAVEMQWNGFESASPWCEYTHPQYHPKAATYIQGRRTRIHLAGWCFVWTRSLYDRIGPLPEDYSFFCADNATEKLMDKHKVAHMLSTKYVVNHLGSTTLRTTDLTERDKLTKEQVRKWNRDYKENKFGWGVAN